MSKWHFEHRLPWPGVRGQRLWDVITQSQHGHKNITSTKMCLYDVELCEVTAGHIALVLRKTAKDGTSPVGTNTASKFAQSNGTPSHNPAPVESNMSQSAIPRVLYVVDAIAPPHHIKNALGSKNSNLSLNYDEPKWTMLTSRSQTFSTSTENTKILKTSSVLGFQSVQQSHEINELELIEELFATKIGKDGCTLAKSPLLCARFDCRVIAIQFTRALPTSILRCVMACEDGMCLIWEWGADLYQWRFLNRFCFLENPNLKWTQPVLHFTTVHCAWGSSTTKNTSTMDQIETTELVWCSTESKDEPKLWLRKIQYGMDTNTFRTEIRVGCALPLHLCSVSTKCGEGIHLRSSKIGLWIISSTFGIYFRSVMSLHSMQMPWSLIFRNCSSIDISAQMLTCIHNITGELIVLDLVSFLVMSVSPVSSDNHTQSALYKKDLLSLEVTNEMERSIQSINTHGQLLIGLTETKECIIWSLLTGARLFTLPLPTKTWAMEPPRISMWTSSGRVSGVGIWTAQGFWQLHTPSAQVLAELHATTRKSRLPQWITALAAVRPYGQSLECDAARFALDVLQGARLLVTAEQREAWEAAISTVSSPSILLSALSSTAPSYNNVTDNLLDELSQLVSSLYEITHDIIVTGRFSMTIDSKDSAMLRVVRQFTPANVESLHHLANWVLLAKRKLARLQTTVYHKGKRQLRSRTISSLTVLADDDDIGTSRSKGVHALPMLEPLVDNDQEVAASQLSRELRPMSSLQFAAGSCSLQNGKQWLSHLELLLLNRNPVMSPPIDDAITPSNLLFHDEPKLSDFKLGLSSFSKHMYFESMSRLYLLHRPNSLLAFVNCIAESCPRIFSLCGSTNVRRSHVERALTLLPAVHTFVERACRESQATPSSESFKNQQRRRQQERIGIASAHESLLVYVDLLCACGFHVDACRVLLDADLFDDCITKLLMTSKFEPQSKVTRMTEKTEGAVYFMLLEYCVRHRGSNSLENLIQAKPHHIDALLVLRSLKYYLQKKIITKSNGSHHKVGRVTVGMLRPVLTKLLQEHKRCTQEAAHMEVCRRKKEQDRTGMWREFHFV